MRTAWIKYDATLQTTIPDLTPFYQHGGKIVTSHGGSDSSIHAASSIRYYDSVRRTMYHDSFSNASTTARGEWYRLFLILGSAHCSPNSMQPNGPFPQTNLEVLMKRVEKGITPETLGATHLAGEEEWKEARICAWLLRLVWNWEEEY